MEPLEKHIRVSDATKGPQSKWTPLLRSLSHPRQGMTKVPVINWCDMRFRRILRGGILEFRKAYSLQ